MHSGMAGMRVAAAGMGLLCLVALNGCGLTVDLSSTPNEVNAGGQVDFTIKLTNPSKCPVGSVTAELVPFVPLNETNVIDGDPNLDRQIREALAAVCTGQSFTVEGINCIVQNGQLFCDLDGGGFPLNPSGLKTSGKPADASPFGAALACQSDGSRLACKLPSFESMTSKAPVRGPMPSLSCFELDPVSQEIGCAVDQIATGGSVMANVSLNAPGYGHVFDNFLFAQANQRGVCKDGSRAGEPCDVDDDCTGGSTGSCATGICIDDMTQATGHGCNITGDCPMGQSCVACESPGITAASLDCTQTVVPFTPAVPAVSMRGLAIAVIALLAVAFAGLRLRPRTR